MKVLVTGWFSFEEMGATAGDLLAKDLVCGWLDESGRPHDVALAPPFDGGVDWRVVDPAGYSDVVFVCGPFGKGPPLIELLERFEGIKLTGVDVTMLDSLDSWNPFELLLERDSSRTSRPDVSFLSRGLLVPVVGVVLVGPQEEYGHRDTHHLAVQLIDRLIARGEAAVVRIDTRLDIPNSGGLRTPAEVESLIARMDVVLTTRLHGMVLALKNGVPAIAIDPIAGGAKLSRQAETIGWPVVLRAEVVSDGELKEAFDFCLTEAARSQARECAMKAVEILDEVRSRFVKEMAG